MKLVFCLRVKAELKKLREEYDKLSSQYEVQKKATNDMAEEILAVRGEFLALQGDVRYWSKTAEKYAKLLGEAITLPNIELFYENGHPVIVDPPNVYNPATGTMYGFEYPIQTADPEYLAIYPHNWNLITKAIYLEVEKALGYARPEVLDCDDWAFIFNAFVAMAWEKIPRINRQGAFGIGISDVIPGQGVAHAYNVYMANDSRMYIVEPQTGRTVGILGQTDHPYKTREVYFSI